MLEKNNFDWINEIVPQKSMTQELINYYHTIKPTWTRELDAAIRILLFAADGGLADRKRNRYYCDIIKTQIVENTLCDGDIFEIAVEILEDPYFFQHHHSTIYITQDHQYIARAAYEQWQRCKI